MKLDKLKPMLMSALKDLLICIFAAVLAAIGIVLFLMIYFRSFTFFIYEPLTNKLSWIMFFVFNFLYSVICGHLMKKINPVK